MYFWLLRFPFLASPAVAGEDSTASVPLTRFVEYGSVLELFLRPDLMGNSGVDRPELGVMVVDPPSDEPRRESGGEYWPDIQDLSTELEREVDPFQETAEKNEPDGEGGAVKGPPGYRELGAGTLAMRDRIDGIC